MKRKSRHTFKMPGIDENLQRIADAASLTADEVVERFMVTLMARKAAYGDLYSQPEPVAYDFVKTPEGQYLEGEDLYREVYSQARRFWLELAATFQAQAAYIRILEGKTTFAGLTEAEQEAVQMKYPNQFKPEYVN